MSTLRIMMIDDDDIQLDIMKEYIALIKTKTQTQFYNNSEKALNYLQNCPIQELPQVIFIDVFMPFIDGWETIKSIEKLIPEKLWNPSVYIVTSSISKSDKEKGKSYPILKDFLNKPIQLSHLISIIQTEYNAIATQQ
jgi:CheY-like chemotaxis protein